MTAFLYPILVEAFESPVDDFSSSLSFSINGIEFQWGQFVVDLAALLLLLVVVYFLFVRRLSSDYEEEDDTRECPECKSSIFVDATRCSFCTAVVPPIVDQGPDV